MSDVSASTASAAVTTPVTSEVATEAPTPNMTGEEAKAWVESQKGKPKEAAASDPIKEAAKEASLKRKVKIDGQEHEVDVDETLKDFAKYKSADNKFREAAGMRKQAEEFITMMRDPEKFFEVATKFGHDPRSLAEKHIAAALENELLDPKEKELREVKRKLKALEDMEAQSEKQKADKVHKTLVEKYQKDYNDQFVSALQESGLPAQKETVAAMAKYISRAANMKFEMTPQEAAQLVKEDIQAKIRSVVSTADGESLMSLLGSETANKIRKWDTGRLKNPESGLKTPAEQADPASTKQRGQPKKRMTPSEWRAYNRR